MSFSDSDGENVSRGQKPGGVAFDASDLSRHEVGIYHSSLPHQPQKSALEIPTPPAQPHEETEERPPVRLRQSVFIRLGRNSPGLKLAAMLAAAVLLMAVTWLSLSYIYSFLNAPTPSSQKSSVKLTPPLICTGIGADGAPAGVSSSFTEDQVKDTGVGVFLTYSGAVPQKDTFEVRWNIGDTLYESKVRVFEKRADILYLNLGRDLPAGSHKIDFLVDGAVQQSATLVIESTSDPVPPVETSQRPRPQTPPRPLTSPGRKPPIQQKAAQPDVPVTPVPAKITTPSASSPRPEMPEQPAEVPKPVVREMVYQAKHWHGIGSCTGELILRPEAIEFISDQHTFTFDIKDVSIDHDGIQDPSSRSWHFLITGTNVEQLLGRWKRGELFPSTAHEPETKVLQEAPQLSANPAPTGASLTRTYEARHKHRLGSCAGELTLTPETIEFSSQQHYFKSQVSNVQIDRDGILDRYGNTWRFEVPGENVAELLRLWKAGKLFSSK